MKRFFCAFMALIMALWCFSLPAQAWDRGGNRGGGGYHRPHQYHIRHGGGYHRPPVVHYHGYPRVYHYWNYNYCPGPGGYSRWYWEDFAGAAIGALVGTAITGAIIAQQRADAAHYERMRYEQEKLRQLQYEAWVEKQIADERLRQGRHYNRMMYGGQQPADAWQWQPVSPPAQLPNE